MGCNQLSFSRELYSMLLMYLLLCPDLIMACAIYIGKQM